METGREGEEMLFFCCNLTLTEVCCMISAVLSEGWAERENSKMPEQLQTCRRNTPEFYWFNFLYLFVYLFDYYLSLIIPSPWLAQCCPGAGGDRLEHPWSVPYTWILCSSSKHPEHEDFLWEWKFGVYSKILQFNYIDQNLLEKTYLWFYLFDIHIFHPHVSHSFKGLSYISLNKQTFVSCNILRGRWNWRPVQNLQAWSLTVRYKNHFVNSN